VLVMRQGKIVAELEGSFDERELMAATTGTHQ
jgi:hypothetical protein